MYICIHSSSIVYVGYNNCLYLEIDRIVILELLYGLKNLSCIVTTTIAFGKAAKLCLTIDIGINVQVRFSFISRSAIIER